MYELSRVLLRSVGPAAARYEDVLIDLSSAGAPVVTTPGTLFGDDGPVRRPSPASVLHLVNGGGKSVFIKLVFSVLLPGHRQAVGTTSTHALSSFVLEGDVSHIVLEWVHAKSGRHLVTGKVSAWKNGRPARDLRQLEERWYHFRPTETLGLRTLPVVENGRYRPLADYCRQLVAAAEEDPALEYSCVDVHRKWTERLSDLGLDPELFRYQRAMNAEEGEAADAFSFAGDDAFVNSLLNAVLPPEPAEELAGVVGAFADKLAERSSLELEREFVRGALTHLAPLAEARRSSLAETGRRNTARARLDQHLRLIRVRAHRENAHAEACRTESRDLTELLKRETDRRTHLAAVTTEAQRLVAGMRLAAAEATERQHRTGLQRARLVENGWQAVPTALRHRDAVTADLRLREIVAATNKAAQPALAARDSAAATLRYALGALHEETERQAGAAESAGRQQDELAGQAQADHNAAVSRAAELTAEAAVRRTAVETVRHELATAVREGRLPEGTSAAEAVVSARARVVQAENHVASLEASLADLDEAREGAEQRCTLARAAVAAADEAARAAERELREATARTESLAADPDLVALAGGDVVLDRDATDLHDRLALARREVEAAQALLQVAIAGDERARTALETTELLPPSVAAVRATRMLKEEGITAWAGWDYLASLNDVERRRQLLRRAPELASGVIVNDRFGEARDILDRSGLWPTEHLSVGTADRLLTGTDEEPAEDGPYVVPVHPALYDEQAADEERIRLTERHRDQLRQQTELRDRGERHAALHTRLGDWRSDFPPGHLEALGRESQQREAASAAAGAVLLERQAELERIAGERRAVNDALPPARRDHMSAVRAAEDLDRLAEREARIPGWESAEKAALEAAGAERVSAGQAAERGERCRALAAEQRRAADALRGTALRLMEELDALPEVDRLPGGGPSPSAQPVEVLRRAFAAAAQEFERVSVGDDLRAKAALARDRLDAAEQELGDLAPAVRRKAEELLAGPEAADKVSRALAREAAERAVGAAEARLAESATTATALRAEVQAFKVPDEPVDLTPFTGPETLDEGLALVADAEQARTESEQAVLDLGHRSERAAARAKEAAREARLFKDLSTVLGPGPGGDPTPDEPAFEGDVPTARQRHDDARSRLDDADRALAEARRTERTLTGRLVQHAVDGRFVGLKLPNREIIGATDPAELPAHAAHWTHLLSQRLRSLETDLETIDRHRKAIVSQLRQQVEEALRVVRRAESLSRLPDGLDRWSGKPFLQIAFTAAADDVLTDRLGTVIDEVSGETTGGRSTKRDGLSLVLRGVSAAVGTSGFKVRILKPDSVLRDQRVPVSEIKDVFSGGQVLTVAIVLYCTMAALRSSEQGRTRHRHSGVLFLDNPIGRASASYLLQVQQAVAAALGVQLVYTTGIFDLDVLENFPLVVRLRNAADLAAHRKYLTVEETIRPLLDSSPPADGEHGEITEIRYYRRPSEDDRDEA
ncbi:hypothetical protein [Kitasatospora sp. NPDC093558]|uniref:hypothetical protein n=1 Tax=Kitasatospora sp. NPDC093558 TaxID=3155201 RepID=UPI00341FB57F